MKRKREEPPQLPSRVNHKKRKTTKNDISTAFLVSGRYFHDKDPEKALDFYTFSIEQNPDNVEPYVFRGLLYHFNLNKKKKALEDYNKSIEINQRYFYAYRLRGRLFFELKNFKKAIYDYEIYITLAPNDSQGYYYLGKLYCEGLKKYDLGMNNLSEAIQRAKNDNEKNIFYTYRGQIFEKIYKFYRSAIKDYCAAINNGNISSGIFIRRALLYYKLKEYVKAIPDFNIIIRENDPRFFKFYLYRAKCYVSCRKFNKAMEDYSAYISINPQYSCAYLNRGKLFEQFVKDYSAALADYMLALKYGPDNELVKESINNLLYSKFEGSSDIFEILNKIHKNNIFITEENGANEEQKKE